MSVANDSSAARGCGSAHVLLDLTIAYLSIGANGIWGDDYLLVGRFNPDAGPFLWDVTVGNHRLGIAQCGNLVPWARLWRSSLSTSTSLFVTWA